MLYYLGEGLEAFFLCRFSSGVKVFYQSHDKDEASYIKEIFMFTPTGLRDLSND